MNVTIELRRDGSVRTSWQDIRGEPDGNITLSHDNQDFSLRVAARYACRKIRAGLRRRPILFSDLL